MEALAPLWRRVDEDGPKALSGETRQGFGRSEIKHQGARQDDHGEAMPARRDKLAAFDMAGDQTISIDAVIVVAGADQPPEQGQLAVTLGLVTLVEGGVLHEHRHRNDVGSRLQDALRARQIGCERRRDSPDRVGLRQHGAEAEAKARRERVPAWPMVRMQGIGKAVDDQPVDPAGEDQVGTPLQLLGRHRIGPPGPAPALGGNFPPPIDIAGRARQLHEVDIGP